MENSNKALLIVDVQNGFVNDATRHIVPKVEALQKQYAHVYATRFINTEGSPYRKLLDWHRFYASSDDVPLAFQPVDGVIVIDKHVYTCVTPAFLDDLRSKGIEEVAICGIDTDACVSACAIGLFENGIRPILLSEACASHAGPEYPRSRPPHTPTPHRKEPDPMTTPPADSNSPDTIPRSPTVEAAQSEAGLRRVLAYICAQRHRRLIAFTGVFLVILAVVKIPISMLIAILYPVAFAALGGFTRFESDDAFSSTTIFVLVQTTLNLVLPLTITLLIFGRLRKTYKKYIPTGQPMGASDFGELDG